MSEIRSILKNSKINSKNPSKKPIEPASALQATNDSEFNSPKKTSSKHPQSPVHDRTPQKPNIKSVLTHKKLFDDHLFNTDTADTESETGVRAETSTSPEKAEKSKKTKASSKNDVSESEDEEESTSSAKLLARTAARKGTHDPTRVTAKTRLKTSKDKVQTNPSTDNSSNSETQDDSISSKSNQSETPLPQTESNKVTTSENKKESTSLKSGNNNAPPPSSSDSADTSKKSISNGSRLKTKQHQNKSLEASRFKTLSTVKKRDFPFSSSDSEPGDLVIDESSTKKKDEKAITAKVPKPTGKKSTLKPNNDSSDSSSSDDEIFKKLKARRPSSKASSINGSIRSVKAKSSSSDSDSDQFR